MIVSMLVTLIIVGIALYLINTLVPMDGKVKTILNAVVVVGLLLWIARSFGYLPAGKF